MTKKVNFKKAGIVLTAGILLTGMTACGAGQETSQSAHRLTAPHLLRRNRKTRTRRSASAERQPGN